VALAALAAVCFGLLAWALVEAAVVESAGPSGRRYTVVLTREDDPGRYWLVVGLLGFFGALLAALAALEGRTYRALRNAGTSATSSPELMMKIDRVSRLYPERWHALQRAKRAATDANSPEVDAALDNLLEKVLKAPDRETALSDLQSLVAALNRVGKL